MPVVKKQRPKAKRRKKGKGVLARIAPISLSSSGIKLNIYGRSATGKTTLACTFPKPLLLIGTEDGTRSVFNVKGVKYVRLWESGELTKLIDHILDGESYKTVVLDTASSLQNMILKEVLGLEKLPAQSSWGMATQQQWGQCALQTKERLGSLLDLASPGNAYQEQREYTPDVVIVAQERDFDTDAEGDLLMPYVASALTPSVTGWLNPACDYICQTFIRGKMKTKVVKVGKKKIRTKKPGKGVEYCLRTAPDAVFTTKFRLPRGASLPDVIVDPSFKKINDLIRQT